MPFFHLTKKLALYKILYKISCKQEKEMKFISISSIQKSNKVILENDVVCVLKNNTPAFYTVSVERMQQLLAMEKSLKASIQYQIDKVAESLSIDSL